MNLVVGLLAVGMTNQVGVQRSLIEQPYPYLHGGAFTGKAVPASPDPLIRYRWDNPKASDNFQVFSMPPKSVVGAPASAFSGLKSLTRPTTNVLVKGEGSIRIDFGVEVPAWIEFDSPDCPGDVEMSISEYNEPGIDKTRVATKHGNTYRLELNGELYEGVRFAWIHVKAPKVPWRITGIRAMCQAKPTNYTGSFHSSDPQLNRIWYMSAYGVKASLCRDYFGSILMDRGDRISWTGDAHPTQAAALVAFSNYDLVLRNLENTSGDDNGIRSYSLYWVLSLLDYYRYTGDSATLAKFVDNASKKLDSAYKVFGTNPDLRFYGWDERVGAGFEIWFRPNQESQDAYKMLSIRAWREFAEVMATLGRPDLSSKYAGYARERLASLEALPDPFRTYGIHAAADAVNTGLLGATAQQSLYDREFSDRLNRLSISPFNQYFILQALGRMGKWDDALATVQDMWGGMVDYGGTTTFEVYRPSWNEIIGRNDAVPNSQSGIVSLCHPWGAGVVMWLTEQVLGIKPTSPGFTTFEFAPHLGSKLSYVSGSVQSPKGLISAELNLTTGKGSLSVPEGTTATIRVPKSGRRISTIKFRDGRTWTAGQWSETEDAVVVQGLGAGDHGFQVSFEGTRTKVSVPKIAYATRLLTRDASTSGDWVGKYGSKGYILCGVKPDGSDEQKLPAFVESVDFFRAFPKAGRPDTTVWAKATDDRRALASGVGPRVAAALSNNDQTMTFMVKTRDAEKHRIAIYFVDWEAKGWRSAVEVFDGSNLRMVAPVSMIKDHKNGIYLVFECKGSTKFRFNKIRGDLVTLSGVFFD